MTDVTRKGVVGHEAAKFTPMTEAAARGLIRRLLADASLAVSGRSPLGGIDIWTEEEAANLGVPMLSFPPTTRQWDGPGGFKERNQKIADNSDVGHCIVVAELPPTYSGRRFPYCYHCKTDSHIKSGGCWTVLRCPRRQWHIIAADGGITSVPESPSP